LSHPMVRFHLINAAKPRYPDFVLETSQNLW